MLAKTPLRDLMTMWLELQDPDKYYQWDCPFSCACAQFAHTLSRERAHGWFGRIGTGMLSHEWEELNGVARGPGMAAHPKNWTFGKMLQRMKEAA